MKRNAAAAGLSVLRSTSGLVRKEGALTSELDHLRADLLSGGTVTISLFCILY